MNLFNFKKKNILYGEEVDLHEAYRIKDKSSDEYITCIYYDIYLHDTNIRVGRCDLRLGKNIDLYYAGNIGYNIFEGYRGNYYALKACKLLFALAKSEYGFKDLIITCSPDNTASYKTCVGLRGKLIATEPVPEYHWLYKRGEVVKCIFKFEL